MQTFSSKPSQICLKKAAFRNSIRRQWLDKYLKQKRLELIEMEKEKQIEQQKINQQLVLILQNLPQSTEQLSVMLTNSKQISNQIMKFFYVHVDTFIDFVPQFSICTFYSYIHILTAILISYPDSHEKILHTTFRKMMHQGKKLIKEHKIMGLGILENLVEYIISLSQVFSKMDQLQVDQIVDIFTELLSISQYATEDQHLEKIHILTLEAINKFLISTINGSFDEQQQENISDTDQKDFDYLKITFINKMFCQKTYNIRHIINYMHKSVKNRSLIFSSLRVLTNLTYFTTSQVIYYSIFDAEVSNIIFFVQKFYSNKQQIMLVLVRLVNNLLVHSKEQCQLRIKEMHINKFVKIFEQNQGKQRLVHQFCSFFTNIITSMDGDVGIIDYLIDQKIFDALCYGIQNIQDTQQLYKIFYSFNVLFNFNKQLCRQLLSRLIPRLNIILEDREQQFQSILTQLIQNVGMQDYQNTQQVKQVEI